MKIKDKIEFKAVDQNKNTVFLKDIKTKKVISLFPKLNTRICDMQTLQMAKWAKKYKNIAFINLTMDKPSVAKNWCSAKNTETIIWSDRNFKNFSNQYGLFDKAFFIRFFKRGFIMLDKNNVVVDIKICKSSSHDPEYNAVEKFIGVKNEG